MRSFEYYTPTRVIFGKDTHLKAGSLLKDEGCRKVLIHYGSGRAVASGLLEEVQNSLKEAGVDFVTLGGVVSNPVSAKSVRELNSVKRRGGFSSGSWRRKRYRFLQSHRLRCCQSLDRRVEFL